MIKKLLSISLLIVTVSLNAQQVQNPGFETWASGFPTGWGTFSEAILNGTGINPNTESQTSTKHSGSLAILLENKLFAAASSNIPGGICTGPIGFTGQPVRGFQAYTSKPTSYDFWYQFTATGGDSAYSTLIISKWNTGTNKRDTLAAGGCYIILAASVYTNVTVPITWLVTGVTPDSIQLFFSSSRKKVGGSVSTQPPIGGQLFLDDINFTTPVGIETVMADGTFSKAYPNPAVGTINISTNLKDAKYAKVYDLTGRMVNSYEINYQLAKVDLSSYEGGMYMYVITDSHNNRLHTSKFNVIK